MPGVWEKPSNDKNYRGLEMFNASDMPSLEVTYSYPGVSSDIDKKIEDGLKAIGYRRWGSSYDANQNYRHLMFEYIGSKD